MLGNKENQWVVDYPKFKKNAVFVEQTFCENLSGAINAILVYSEPIQLEIVKKIVKSLPTGITNEKHLRTLKSICPSSKCSAWTTFRAKENIIKSVYNITDTYITLNGNSGIYNPIKYIPSIKDTVPFLFIASKLNIPLAQEVLFSTIEIAWIHLHSLAINKDVRFEKESKVFIRSLGLALLSLNPKVANNNIIRTIGNFMMLSSILQKKLLKMIAATINFWVNIDNGSLSLFWEIVKANIACDTVEYADIINVYTILRFMKSIDASLSNSPCCNKHSIQGSYKKEALSVKYDSMRSLLKFMIINNSSEITENIAYIVNVILTKPCACLFVALIVLLRDLAECNVGYILELQKLGVITDLFKAARNYPADIKVECIFFASIILDQLYKNSSTQEAKSFKFALLHMLETSSGLRDKLKARLSALKAKPQRSDSVTYSRTKLYEEGYYTKRDKSVGNKVKLGKEFIKRERVVSIEHNGRYKKHSVMITDAPDLYNEVDNLLIDTNPLIHKSITRNIKEKVKLPYIYLKLIDEELELLCVSLFLWLVGERPNKSVVSKKEIVKPQALSILLSVLKKENNDHATKKCLEFFHILIKLKSNRQHLFKSNKLLNWLLALETQYHSKSEDNMKKLVYSLHAILLCEGLKTREGVEEVIQTIMMWSYTIQLKNETKPGRNFSVGSTQYNETTSWICLKHLLIEAMKYAEELLQVWALIEIVFKLIIGHSTKKGITLKLPANPFANPFATEEDLYVSDQEFIEATINLALRFCESEGAIEKHKEFLNESSKKVLTVNGYTGFLIALIKIVLKNVKDEDLEKLVLKINRISQYMVQLAEYVKDNNIEKENLLLLISILLQEHNKAQKTKSEDKATILRNTLSSIISHITSENTYIQTKYFIKKTLNLEALNDVEEYNVVYEKNVQVAKELNKVSDKAFSELQIELRKMVESFIRQKQEIKVKAARNRFNLNLYLYFLTLEELRW